MADDSHKLTTEHLENYHDFMTPTGWAEAASKDERGDNSSAPRQERSQSRSRSSSRPSNTRYHRRGQTPRMYSRYRTLRPSENDWTEGEGRPMGFWAWCKAVLFHGK